MILKGFFMCFMDQDLILKGFFIMYFMIALHIKYCFAIIPSMSAKITKENMKDSY